MLLMGVGVANVFAHSSSWILDNGGEFCHRGAGSEYCSSPHCSEVLRGGISRLVSLFRPFLAVEFINVAVMANPRVWVGR